jgi:DNA-binding GntR family transcriptional regulator
MSQPAPKPRYLQIADDVRLHVRTGDLQVGAALPSEPALARRYGVNRATIRQALAVLRDEGLISTGARSRSRIIRTASLPTEDIQPATGEIAALLQLPVGTPVTRRRRMSFRPDGTPDELVFIYRAKMA